MNKKFIFTCGDINGIGPEIVIKTLNIISKKSDNSYYFICPQNVFEDTCQIIKPVFKFRISEKIECNDSLIQIIPLKKIRQSIGKPTVNSGKVAYDAVKLAVDLTNSKIIDAIITAPLSKSALYKAGINFPGHTEMIAKWTNSKHFVMTFLSKKMFAALITIHEPIKNIPGLLTPKILHEKFDVIINTLKNDLNIKQPKIAVLGLNPHSGEAGILGKEEIDIIIPAIHSYKLKKHISGPYSPDAFFASRKYEQFDITVGMYHDQILIPFKLLNFGGGVNYTAGLPVVRTSPDHGVAYDIAGKNLAKPDSMLEAFYYAERIVKNRK